MEEKRSKGFNPDNAATVLRAAAAIDKCRTCGCLHASLLEADNVSGKLSRLASVLLAGLPPAEINCRECDECPPGEVISSMHGVKDKTYCGSCEC